MPVSPGRVESLTSERCARGRGEPPQLLDRERCGDISSKPVTSSSANRLSRPPNAGDLRRSAADRRRLAVRRPGFLALLGRRETHWLETPVGSLRCSWSARSLTRSTSAPRIRALSRAGRAGADRRGSCWSSRRSTYPRFSFVDRQSSLIGAPAGGLQPARGLDPVHLLGHLGAPDRRHQRHGRAPDLRRLATEPDSQAPAGSCSATRWASTDGRDALRGPRHQLLYGFLGLLIAITVITALTSLNLLAELPPVKRTIASAGLGPPYLAASTFGSAGSRR